MYINLFSPFNSCLSFYFLLLLALLQLCSTRLKQPEFSLISLLLLLQLINEGSLSHNFKPPREQKFREATGFLPFRASLWHAKSQSPCSSTKKQKTARNNSCYHSKQVECSDNIPKSHDEMERRKLQVRLQNCDQVGKRKNLATMFLHQRAPSYRLASARERKT